MGKKKRRKKTKEVLKKTVEIKQSIEIPILNSESPSQEQHFELMSFPMVSLREDYDASSDQSQDRGFRSNT